MQILSEHFIRSIKHLDRLIMHSLNLLRLLSLFLDPLLLPLHLGGLPLPLVKPQPPVSLPLVPPLGQLVHELVEARLHVLPLLCQPLSFFFLECGQFLVLRLKEEALVVLQSAIAGDYPNDGLHVWVADRMVLLYQLIHVDGRLPEVHLAIEAEVQDDK